MLKLWKCVKTACLIFLIKEKKKGLVLIRIQYPNIQIMKFRLHVRLIASLVIAVLCTHSSFAQSKMVINGAKVNMDTAVYLNVTDLVVNSGTLIVLPETHLRVAGDIISSSGVYAIDGTVEMNGSGNQQISNNAFSSNLIKNMIITSTGGQVSVAGGSWAEAALRQRVAAARRAVL